MGIEMALTAYGPPLTPFNSFKYLGGVLTAEDENWPAVVGNLQRIR